MTLKTDLDIIDQSNVNGFLPTVSSERSVGLQMESFFSSFFSFSFSFFTPPTFGCKDDLSMWRRRRRNTSYSYYSSSSSFSFSTPLTFQITWNICPVSQMRSCYKTMSNAQIKLMIRDHETGLLTDFATQDVVK